MNGVRGTQGCGVLTWECVGTWPAGIFFFSVPLDGFVLFFFCACGCKGSGWPSGVEGGAVYGHSTKEVASPGHRKSKVS